jgi:formylglycine-generating enzyme required for sulfatase activity
MTGVTWFEAMEFCQRLGEREGCRYRLPLESEWECACRAGVNGAWSGTGDPDDMGWTAQNSSGRLHRPGEKQFNHWGLFDMHGNAAEWCWDWYNPIYPTTEVDPVFRDPTARRVVRGGAYDHPVPDARSAARASERPDNSRADIGFRVVREEPNATYPSLDGR